MIDISFELNGTMTNVGVEPGETLLELLRNRLKMTGTKRGCEVGECGACTVLIDGVPTDSCLYMAVLADGHKVTTIEGISQNNELAAIQQAFVDKGAIQCGFCTPGLVLSSYAFIKKNGKATAEEIKKGLAGNFCRCAAYSQVIDAVQTAAERMAEDNN